MPRLSPLAVLLVATLGALSASASERVFLAVGETKILNISRDLKGAEAEDASLLGVKKKSHGAVAIVGKALGVTPVTLRTRDGNTFEVLVHVVPAGATVYSLDRDDASGRTRASAVNRDGADVVAGR